MGLSSCKLLLLMGALAGALAFSSGVTVNMLLLISEEEEGLILKTFGLFDHL